MTNDRERIRKILIFPNFYCPNYFSLFFLANINSGLTSGELCILISGPTLHTDWTRQLFFQHAVKMEVSSFLSRFTQQCWWGTRLVWLVVLSRPVSPIAHPLSRTSHRLWGENLGRFCITGSVCCKISGFISQLTSPKLLLREGKIFRNTQ